MTDKNPQNEEEKSEKLVKSAGRPTQHNSQASASLLNKVKLCIAILLVVAGVWLYYDQAIKLPASMHILAPVIAVILALVIVLFWCDFERRLLRYIRDSIGEIKKVVWPTRNDALRMTVFVIIFVTILAIFIYMADSVISWLFYDVLLKRG